MLKACRYCGKIHAKDFVCEKKPQSKRENSKDQFRSTQQWKNKRNEIKKRDKFICQACFNNLFGTKKRITTDNLSVHHIIPLEADYDLRLDNKNLITLCAEHHEIAECGRISAKQLKDILPPEG